MCNIIIKQDKECSPSEMAQISQVWDKEHIPGKHLFQWEEVAFLVNDNTTFALIHLPPHGGTRYIQFVHYESNDSLKNLIKEIVNYHQNREASYNAESIWMELSFKDDSLLLLGRECGFTTGDIKYFPRYKD